MEITVGILAGGKSTRMGTNKAFLPYKQTSFIEAIAKGDAEAAKTAADVHIRQLKELVMTEGV